MIFSQLDTPALLVDLEAMDQNIRQMQAQVSSCGLNLRPHGKAHKIPALAQRQLAQGAQGICTAKLGEAEVMAAAGIPDILITTPIAGETKYQRLISLHLVYPTVRFCQVVDHPDHVHEIARHAAAAGITVDLLIEVESGQQRCGVAVGEALLNLVRLIVDNPHVHYRGVQAYSGHLQHVHGFAERQRQARAAVLPLFDFIASVLRPIGLAPAVVSGGGTGTYPACEGLGFTEIQAGSYLFMDAAYRATGNSHGDAVNDSFLPALKVLTTVISTPTPHRAVIDAGMKSLSTDMGMPLLDGFPAVQYLTGGDEHGKLMLPDGHAGFAIGQRLLMLPSHCDTTLNNFNTLHGVRDGHLVESWPIAARGRCD